MKSLSIRGEISESPPRDAWKLFCADLVERGLEREGNACLKTRDDELSFLVQKSFDKHASVGTFVAMIVAHSWKLSCISVRYVMDGPGKHQKALHPLLFCEKGKDNM